MTLFLDVRLSSTGGNLAASVAVNQGTSIADYQSVDKGELINRVRGKNVLIGTHGFNVNRADGIAHLSNWAGLLRLDPPAVFVGLLWPGDSVWAHGLDYPEEPRIADEAGGNLIAPFIDTNFGNAASVSFVSHSLGARLVLEAVSKMNLPVRRVTLMAGAIDDNCLNTEFGAAAARIGAISVLSSKKDTVLSDLFPLGNLIRGIIAEGHPWWRGALGRSGPTQPRPGNFRSPFEIPDNWDFLHSSYLQIDPPPTASIPIPTYVPENGSPFPVAEIGWREAWSAAFVSTQFR